MTCRDIDEIVEERIDRILTQYRESPNLLFLLRTYLRAAADVGQAICDLPEKFDIETATGDQLTLLGKRLGWPRCHCVCGGQPVFGFDCGPVVEYRPIIGFEAEGSNSTWEVCLDGLTELCIWDDETYRKFLKVRRYQMMRFFDFDSLNECLRIFFGETAHIVSWTPFKIVVTPGRELTENEVMLLQLYPRVLPAALGMRILFHFATPEEPEVFGFGDGWGGFCENDWTNNRKYFGFGVDWGGFCTEGESTEESRQIHLDEKAAPVYTDWTNSDDAPWLCPVGAPWLCPIDVKPYSC
ncbi:MAG: hypothetical protein [Caudoviricetes sp.]|nr:MAG: hypothetical protein [Caudoviricetes sp.]